MKKLILLLTLFLLFCNCNDNRRQLVIKGELRTDRNFNGEMLYLAPMGSKDMSLRDSVVMKDGHFTFTKEADTFYIAVLRPKNFLQSFYLQPLLVAIEPGTLEVRLDSVSYGKGTPLNDILQGWKENRTSFGEAGQKLRKQIREAEGVEKAELEAQLKQVDADYSEYNFNFVKENKDNPIGKICLQYDQSVLLGRTKKIPYAYLNNNGTTRNRNTVNHSRRCCRRLFFFFPVSYSVSFVL